MRRRWGGRNVGCNWISTAAIMSVREGLTKKFQRCMFCDSGAGEMSLCVLPIQRVSVSMVPAFGSSSEVSSVARV